MCLGAHACRVLFGLAHGGRERPAWRTLGQRAHRVAGRGARGALGVKRWWEWRDMAVPREAKGTACELGGLVWHSANWAA